MLREALVSRMENPYIGMPGLICKNLRQAAAISMEIRQKLLGMILIQAGLVIFI